MHKTRPILGISAGDPAGIGPEVTLKALCKPHIYDMCQPVLVCSKSILEATMADCGLSLQIECVNEDNLAESGNQYGVVRLVDLDNVDMQKFQYGQVSSMCGNASFEYVAKVIEMAQKGRIQATVTGPINKEALRAGGHQYAGHTEIYATLTKTRDYAMMLMDGGFRVSHVSTHCSLREACERTQKERIMTVLKLTHSALEQMGIVHPKIAVSGLNPHAGENGLFGTEEIEEIIPAVEWAQENKMNVDGPWPPDTIFAQLQGGQFDAVVAMYHDQGHIPTKLVGFHYDYDTGNWTSMSGVNVTLGLPIIRTSVDHGTAFDRAGQNVANPESMVQAIEMAVKLS